MKKREDATVYLCVLKHILAGNLQRVQLKHLPWKDLNSNQADMKFLCFSVFKEFENVFNLKILYAVIACLVVAGVVLLLCAGLSFYNEFTKSSYVILGSVGLYIFNAIACEYIAMSLFNYSLKPAYWNKLNR